MRLISARELSSNKSGCSPSVVFMLLRYCRKRKAPCQAVDPETNARALTTGGGLDRIWAIMDLEHLGGKRPGRRPSLRNSKRQNSKQFKQCKGILLNSSRNSGKILASWTR